MAATVTPFGTPGTVSTVTITAGVPTAGTGTVSTLDNIFNATNGPIDVKAASTAPVATDRSMVVGISPNSWDVGTGTSGSKTQRVIMDSSQLAPLATTAQARSAGFQLVDIPTDGTLTRDLFGQYETVAASQAPQTMGGTGATGDYLAYVVVFPGTAGCGVVTILDNATTWGTFAGGGTTALPSLVPFRIDVGAYSTTGAWKITTGANVTCVGVGKFT